MVSQWKADSNTIRGKMQDRYIKKIIEYSRKFPSASDSLIENMAKKQFSEGEIQQLWNKNHTID